MAAEDREANNVPYCFPRWHIQGPVGDMAASGLESKVMQAYAALGSLHLDKIETYHVNKNIQKALRAPIFLKMP